MLYLSATRRKSDAWEIDNKGRPDLGTSSIPENTACLCEYGRKRASIGITTCSVFIVISLQVSQWCSEAATYIYDHPF
jgi:hypothetical protein